MKVAVFGGSGFVGNYIINELIAQNYEVNVLVRKGSQDKVESLDKCNVFYGDILDVDIVKGVIDSCDTIIYNIGIIREFKSKNITYKALHYEGAKLTIDIAKDLNINRYIMMSANGVKPNGTGYQKTKYDAEVYLKNNLRDWTIIRPSLIFGDSKGKKEFCSELKKDMLSLPFPAPAFFSGLNILSAGMFKMSPIHIKDVSRIFVGCIENNHSFKKIYELGGDDFTWKEIIKIIGNSYGKNKLIIPAPALFVQLAALILDRFEWFPISYDQLVMLLEGNTCDSSDIFKRYSIDPIKFSSKNINYLND